MFPKRGEYVNLGLHIFIWKYVKVSSLRDFGAVRNIPCP